MYLCMCLYFFFSTDKVFRMFLTLTDQVFTDQLKDIESLEFLNLAEKLQVSVRNICINKHNLRYSKKWSGVNKPRKQSNRAISLSAPISWSRDLPNTNLIAVFFHQVSSVFVNEPSFKTDEVISFQWVIFSIFVFNIYFILLLSVSSSIIQELSARKYNWTQIVI